MEVGYEDTNVWESVELKEELAEELATDGNDSYSCRSLIRRKVSLIRQQRLHKLALPSLHVGHRTSYVHCVVDEERR